MSGSGGGEEKIYHSLIGWMDGYTTRITFYRERTANLVKLANYACGVPRTGQPDFELTRLQLRTYYAYPWIPKSAFYDTLPNQTPQDGFLSMIYPLDCESFSKLCINFQRIIIEFIHQFSILVKIIFWFLLSRKRKHAKKLFENFKLKLECKFWWVSDLERYVKSIIIK